MKWKDKNTRWTSSLFVIECVKIETNLYDRDANQRNCNTPYKNMEIINHETEFIQEPMSRWFNSNMKMRSCCSWILWVLSDRCDLECSDFLWAMTMTWVQFWAFAHNNCARGRGEFERTDLRSYRKIYTRTANILSQLEKLKLLQCNRENF